MTVQTEEAILAKVLEPNIRLERRNAIVALKTINFPHSGYQLAEGISQNRKNKKGQMRLPPSF